MDDPTRRDLLSDLPLSIIHDILVRVPVRDAVRTSLLSRQWRHTWTSLPHLLFNFFGPSWFGLGHFMTEEFQDGADKFVTNVLALHKGPIHRFEMSYWCNNNLKSSWYKFEEWIHCLSNNEIRELIFKVFSEEDRGANVLNSSSIYSCAKLIKLELWFFVLPPPPSTFKGFFFLTSLVLGGVDLSPNTVESLIPYCPLLEKLRIMHSKSSETRISSPNLKSMDLSGHYQKLCLSAPLLAKLHLDLKRGEFTRENLSSVCNYVNLLGSFTNLVELGGGGFFLKYLSTGFESCHPTLVFHHLKVMNLQMNFGDTKETSVVARLIIGAPNLHTLRISPNRQSGDSHISLRDFGFAPNFTLEKLKVVSVPWVSRYYSGMQLIKFLLEISPVLEIMEVEFIDPNCLSNVSAELQGFRRASPNARILV